MVLNPLVRGLLFAVPVSLILWLLLFLVWSGSTTEERWLLGGFFFVGLITLLDGRRR